MKIDNYIDKTNYIINSNFTEILSTEKSILLIALYSKMYLNGAECRTCKNSQLKYYERLKRDGMKTAEKMEKVRTRTCTPKWDGDCFISKAGRHFPAHLLTDEDAIYLLSNKYISEEKFLVLPRGYNETVQVSEIKETKEFLACVAEVKEKLISGISKSKIKNDMKNVSNIGEQRCSQKMVLELIKRAEKEINENI